MAGQRNNKSLSKKEKPNKGKKKRTQITKQTKKK